MRVISNVPEIIHGNFDIFYSQEGHKFSRSNKTVENTWKQLLATLSLFLDKLNFQQTKQIVISFLASQRRFCH